MLYIEKINHVLKLKKNSRFIFSGKYRTKDKRRKKEVNKIRR